MNSHTRCNALVDLLCKMHDRWLRRYVELLHKPCHVCGTRPLDDPDRTHP